MIDVTPLTRQERSMAQSAVARLHYLHTPVDPRCSVEGYSISLYDDPAPVGYLLFGRPEAPRCADWYGSVDDVRSGRCEVTRWQVINLARVLLYPDVQPGGEIHALCLRGERILPGYTDRKGIWRSTLASTAINLALDRVVVDYLTRRPPCFPDEPWQLEYCLSYCDSRIHRGTLYRAAGFELYRKGKHGIDTWRKRLRPLAEAEQRQVLQSSETSERSRRYRAARAPGSNALLPGFADVARGAA